MPKARLLIVVGAGIVACLLPLLALLGAGGGGKPTAWSSLRLLPVRDWGFGQVSPVRVPIFIPAKLGDHMRVTQFGSGGGKMQDTVYLFTDGGFQQEKVIGSPAGIPLRSGAVRVTMKAEIRVTGDGFGVAWSPRGFLFRGHGYRRKLGLLVLEACPGVQVR